MENFNDSSEDLTSIWCETRRHVNLHFPTLHWQFNNTATSPPTAIKFLLKRESKKVKISTTMANHDLRMNRTNPQISRVVRHRWYLKYLVWFLQLFVVCLVCSWYSLQLIGVFPECVLLPCACACFWPLGLKNPMLCKRTLVREPLYTVCFPLSIYVSTSSIDKLKTRKLTLTLILVDSNSPRVSM
jgi:hypothetical protein